MTGIDEAPLWGFFIGVIKISMIAECAAPGPESLGRPVLTLIMQI
jgi:hypothetical protein